MSWIEEFNGIFFLSLATILAGSFGLAIRYCLKSKCEDFSLCYGLLRVERRVDLETQVDMRALELGINNDEVSTQVAERRPSLTQQSQH
jgi:hypothetical protein